MKKNIKSQIMTGYVLILVVPLVLALVTVGFSVKIADDIDKLSGFRQNQNMTANAIVGHYKWVMDLGDTILEGKEFTGSLDPTTCGLGKWVGSVSPEDLVDPDIQSALNKLKEPHDKIHTEVSSIIELSKTDKYKAYDIYVSDIKPQVDGIIADIGIVTGRYEAFAEDYSKKISNDITVMIVINAVLVVLGLIAAILYGNRTSKRISEPVSTVADWSMRMAIGDTNLDFSEFKTMNLAPENEIAKMVKSFEAMAASIQNNVKVVQRVAQGDLTAFVEIRSNMDVLGQNIYRMVQENDHIFSDILEVSSNVASSANQISVASSSLAQNTAEQAGTIEKISDSLNVVDQLTQKNKVRVEQVQDAFSTIHDEVEEGGEQMKRLVAAVSDIKVASDKIYGVIKSIDDISTQTNLLALNASVEAARAGEAGKGFAVVADEVRQLALKSALAAGESKELIENTISKTGHGTKIVAEANSTFQKIASSVNSTMEVTHEIVDAATQQSEASSQVNQSVKNVADMATRNSAISEESAAASEEMRANAEVLRMEMQKFKLRQRELGKPYIPEEKKNDLEFIKIAEENYRKAVERTEKMEKNLEVNYLPSDLWN